MGLLENWWVQEIGHSTQIWCQNNKASDIIKQEVINKATSAIIRQKEKCLKSMKSSKHFISVKKFKTTKIKFTS